MHDWLKISGYLCVFGFVKEIKPSDPYFVEYILGPWRNITQEQLTQDFYPVQTYSYCAHLFLVFMVTDFLRYKPIIVATGFIGIIVWSLLIWTISSDGLIVLQVFYGAYLASEVAYFSYIYAKVDKKYYSKVTANARAALLIGKLVGSISSQILINFNWMNYRELHYITLTTQICATLWSFVLPSVKQADNLQKNIDEDKITKSEVGTVSVITENLTENSDDNSRISRKLELLWSQFKTAYSNKKVVQWSIWYIVALAGYLQILSYIQVLWKDINQNPVVVWNAGVDAVITLLGSICAFVAGYLKGDMLTHRINLIILSILSIFEGGAILFATWPRNLYISYAGYIIFGALYSFTITMSSAEVALYLTDESFGLIFGINTLIALALQSLVTLVFVSGILFTLTVTEQFSVYGFYFIAIGVIYFCLVTLDFLLQNRYRIL